MSNSSQLDNHKVLFKRKLSCKSVEHPAVAEGVGYFARVEFATSHLWPVRLILHAEYSAVVV